LEFHRIEPLSLHRKDQPAISRWWDELQLEPQTEHLIGLQSSLLLREPEISISAHHWTSTSWCSQTLDQVSILPSRKEPLLTSNTSTIGQELVVL
jgi:hypothetical protein